MPVDVTIQTATSDTTFVANVNQQANTFQFTLSDRPNTVILDRDKWIRVKSISFPQLLKKINYYQLNIYLAQN